jgi:hypothetical protein
MRKVFTQVISGYFMNKKKKPKKSCPVSTDTDWLVVWKAVCVAARLHRKRFHSFPVRQPYLQKVIQCCELLHQHVETVQPTSLAAYLLRDALLFHPGAVHSLADSFDKELLQLAQLLTEEKSSLNAHLGSLSRQQSGSFSQSAVSATPLMDRKTSNYALSRSNSDASFSASLASALDNSMSHSGIYTRQDDELDLAFSSDEEENDGEPTKISSLSKCIFLSEVLFHLLEWKQLLEDGLLVPKSAQYCEYARQVVDFLRGSNDSLETQIEHLVDDIENKRMKA